MNLLLAEALNAEKLILKNGSKLVPNLYFVECIDLDGITGGFNFQAAWTTGRIAGMAMSE